MSQAQTPRINASPSSLGVVARGSAAGLSIAASTKPAAQQVLTWLLFWPLLTLIARQTVYLSGPARDAAAFQNGAAATGARGSHNYVYVNALILLGFALAGRLGIWAVLKRNPLIIASLLLAAASALWSVSAQVTLQMTVQVGLCTLFACYLAGHLATERLMRLLIFMGIAAAGLSILFALLLPSYGIFAGYSGGAWQGIASHKNALGISMAYLLTPALFLRDLPRLQRLLYVGLVLFLIGMSQSRGAWLDTLGVLAFVGWLTLIRRLRAHESLLLLLVSAVTVAGLVWIGHAHFDQIAKLLGKDPTMSGRSAIYAEVWRSLLLRPWLGYGMGGFWTPANVESQRIGLAIGWPNIGYSESGLLEVALQTGLLGLGLVLTMVARAWLQGARLLRSGFYTPRAGWFLTILLLAALTNLDAGWLMTSDTLDWVLILIACIGLERESRLASRLRRGGPQRIVSPVECVA